MNIQSQSQAAAAWGTSWRGIFILLLGVVTYIYVNLFVFPHIPFLLSGDQVYFWVDDQRMLYGEWPYKDFFQFTPPGTDLLFFALFKLFGPRIWVTNMVVLALGVALGWLCFSVASQMMERRLARLATWLFLIVIYGRLLNATHHWFSMLAIMCAVRVVMRESAPARIAIAGALLGLASFFTQTHGAVAVIVFTIWLLWEWSRAKQAWRIFLGHEALLLLGFVTVLLALSAYFVTRAGLAQLWYCQVTFVRQYMVHLPEGQFLGLPEAPTWRRLPIVGQYLLVYILLPITYAVLLRRCWVARHDGDFPYRRQLTLLALLGCFLLVEVLFSLNWLRVYTVSMPGMILLVWLIGTTGKARRYAVGLGWAGIVCLALLQTWSRHHHDYVAAALPAGTAAISPQAYEKLRWVMQHTRPGEFFFDAGWPGVYLPLMLRNPVFAEAVGANEQTPPQSVDRAIQQLETKRVRYVLWSLRLEYPSDLERPSSDSLSPLRSYLRDRYHRMQTFPDQDEVWERK